MRIAAVIDLWLTSRTSVVRLHVRYIDGRRAIILDDYFDLRLVEGTEFAAPDNTTREDILKEASYEHLRRRGGHHPNAHPGRG